MYSEALLTVGCRLGERLPQITVVLQRQPVNGIGGEIYNNEDHRNFQIVHVVLKPLKLERERKHSSLVPKGCFSYSLDLYLENESATRAIFCFELNLAIDPDVLLVFL